MSNILLAYNLNTAVLGGIKNQNKKVENKKEIIRNESINNNLIDSRSLLDSQLKVSIGSNNNMDLLSKYVSGTVENTKYFNYYKPDMKKPVSLVTQLTQNISTVEALDAVYLKQDGYLI